MTAFQRIVCAVDFESNSMAALRVALRLAEQNQAKLAVLHVVPYTDPLMISAPIIAQRRYDNARELLAEIARTESAGAQVETVLKTGHIADEIIGAASQFEADLLVMATHGRTGVPRFVLGSVAEQVLREAPCLVLTVNAKAAEQYGQNDQVSTKPRAA
jgi:nucleotide-binding universal stress UspA family protein